MQENLIVITDRAASSPHTLLAGRFLEAAEKAGVRLLAMDTEFSARGAAGEGAAFRQNGLPVPPLQEKSLLLVLADPAYWFDLSRAQKNSLDDFYRHLLSGCGEDGEATGCALLLCEKKGKEDAAQRVVSLFQDFCANTGLANRGILRTAAIEPIP